MRAQAFESLLKLFVKTTKEEELEVLRGMARQLLDRSVDSSDLIKKLKE